jgi:four helix bundle protein
MDFRFETIDVWVEAIEMSKSLFNLSKKFRGLKHYAISDQLFRATLSITNNIAEGSGSSSSKDFANFLNISRRSVFECANILHIALELQLIDQTEFERLRFNLIEVSKSLYFFRLSVLSK